MVWALVLSAIEGYLIGSVNTSIIISKLKKQDIRKQGSGNAGATNTLRVMGKAFAAMVVAGDALKAVISVLLAWGIAKWFNQGVDMIAYCKYIAALFTVLGHNYPVFFGFKGGKGILTSTTIIFMLDWRIGILVLSAGLFMIVLTRFVSVGSLLGCVLYPMFVFAYLDGETAIYKWAHLVLALILGILGIVRHKNNIKKLVRGEESKIGVKAK